MHHRGGRGSRFKKQKKEMPSSPFESLGIKWRKLTRKIGAYRQLEKKERNDQILAGKGGSQGKRTTIRKEKMRK